jgi:hypothetical protein
MISIKVNNRLQMGQGTCKAKPEIEGQQVPSRLGLTFEAIGRYNDTPSFLFATSLCSQPCQYQMLNIHIINGFCNRY